MSFASSILDKLPVQYSFMALLLAHMRLHFEALGYVPTSRVHVVGVDASSTPVATRSLLPLAVSNFGVGLFCVLSVASTCSCRKIRPASGSLQIRCANI